LDSLFFLLFVTHVSIFFSCLLILLLPILDISVIYLDPLHFYFYLPCALTRSLLLSASKTTTWGCFSFSLSFFSGPYFSIWAVSLSTIKLIPYSLPLSIFYLTSLVFTPPYTPGTSLSPGYPLSYSICFLFFVLYP